MQERCRGASVQGYIYGACMLSRLTRSSECTCLGIVTGERRAFSIHQPMLPALANPNKTTSCTRCPAALARPRQHYTSVPREHELSLRVHLPPPQDLVGNLRWWWWQCHDAGVAAASSSKRLVSGAKQQVRRRERRPSSAPRCAMPTCLDREELKGHGQDGGGPDLGPRHLCPLHSHL